MQAKVSAPIKVKVVLTKVLASAIVNSGSELQAKLCIHPVSDCTRKGNNFGISENLQTSIQL